MRRALHLTVLPLILATAEVAAAQYVPPADAWERRDPAQVGMDAARLAEAVRFAQEHESAAPRDLELAHYMSFGREPFGDAVGPFKERGPQSGLIIRNGYIVAEWGEPARVDMTFSVTKSFLSTVVGLAFDRGLIRDVNDTVASYMAPVLSADGVAHAAESARNRFGSTGTFDLFDTPHNRRITWDHLLRQTSDWEGTLWEKPEWADRPARETATWLTRERVAPGSAYEYNDTRVNVLALAALNVWRRPLPEVLREHVMDPIGASPTWRWYGYENSWVVLDGTRVQSVSGGGHWGGGMFISAYDQARFGLLTLRDGRWGDRQLLSQEWLRMARTPTPAQPTYGFMNFFLNTGRELYASAPEQAFAHLGNGTNLIYCDPVNDLVVVARWIDNGQIDAFLSRVLASVEARATR
ncbi:MAG TPA: serine hydrolase [Longimicrobiales bacterium]|nr:serine hydrolase [Longimicrobiales bacterium]